MFTAEREVEVMSGDIRLSTFEVRYTYTIVRGNPARTWANSMEGNFHPEEDDTASILEVETRWHPSHTWTKAKGDALDMLTAEVTDEWLILQAMEQANA